MSAGLLFAGFLFSLIGLAAFGYGKKQRRIVPMIGGVLLMLYPYFVTNTLACYLIGILIIAAMFLIKE